MKKKHVGIIIGLSAIIGGALGALSVHKPTQEKIKDHAKTVRKNLVQTVKEKASEIKTE